MQSKRWCFTTNNYTEDHLLHLRLLAESVTYLVFGREIAPTTGTPHLQGFCVFPTNQRLHAVRLHFPGSHLSPTVATSQVAAAYCKKDNDFEEFGQVPGPVGKTTKFHAFRDWVLAQPSKPTDAQVAMEWPDIAFHRAYQPFIDNIYPVVVPVLGEYRPYQQSLANILLGDPDDRKIHFIVDTVGNTGKTWFTKKFSYLYPDSVQRLGVGRIEDLSFAIDERKRVFLFDIPRSRAEFFQYTIVEGLKDGFIFSTKYMSRVKQMAHACHVVVFMNEPPNMTALSMDRYKVIHWVSLPSTAAH